jgi:ELWxxDGT repeat protein
MPQCTYTLRSRWAALCVVFFCTLKCLCAQSPTLWQVGDLAQPLPVEGLKVEYLIPLQGDNGLMGVPTFQDYFSIYRFKDDVIEKIDENYRITLYHTPTSTGVYWIERPYNNAIWYLFYSSNQYGGTKWIDGGTGYDIFQSRIALKGRLLFSNLQPETGTELWIRDTTNAPAQLLKDLWPGPQPSNPNFLITGQNYTYFIAGNDSQNNLWRTDGTADGTVELTTGYNPWINGVINTSVQAIGDRLFFVARESNKPQLWTSDGTPSGTYMVRELISTSYNIGTLKSSQVGDFYLFSFNHPDFGTELWISDGTDAGTHVIIDQPNGSSQPRLINTRQCTRNGALYLLLGSSKQIWKISADDGTASMVTDTLQADAEYVVAVNDQYIMYASKNGSQNPYELMACNLDGTNHVSLTSNMAPIPYVYLMGVQSYLVNNKLILKNFEPQGSLTITDGTAQGTRPVLYQLAPSLSSSNPTSFGDLDNGDVYFRTLRNTGFNNKYEVWREPYTTSLISAELLNIDYQTDAYSNNLFFTDTKVYYIKGDSTVCSIQNDTEQCVRLPFRIDRKFVYNDRFYVTPLRPNKYTSLWATDGTESGTEQIYDTILLPYNLQLLNDSLYFTSANDIGSPLANIIWRTNGMQGDTPEIVFSDSIEIEYWIKNNRLCIWSHSDYTSILRITGFPDLQIPLSEYIRNVELVDNKIYLFIGRLINQEYKTVLKIWEQGQWSEIVVLDYYSDDTYFYRTTDNRLFFHNGPSNYSHKLWITDGTVSGTYPYYSFDTLCCTFVDNIIQYNEHITLFTAFDGNDVEWYKSDGTAEGTFPIADIPATRFDSDSEFSYPIVSYPALLRDKHALFFAMDDGQTGVEPWVLLLGDSLTNPTVIVPDAYTQLRIWPNPTTDVLTVQHEPLSQGARLQILDGMGRLLLEQAPDASATTHFNVQQHNWPQGTYYMAIRYPDGKGVGKAWILTR